MRGFILTIFILVSAIAPAEVITSSNMSLPIPEVGVTSGPDYANDINSCLSIIDSHNHTPGYGVAVPSNGLNINTDLSFHNINATNVRSVRLYSQASPLALGTDLGCLYESGVDLFYNDGSGNQIRLTQSGGIAGTPGSIANLVSPASASYVGGSTSFVWQSAASTSANMDMGSIILRNLTASSKGITISPPNALANNYSMTLPAALPGSTSLLSLSSAGAIASTLTPTLTSITFGSSVLTSVGTSLVLGAASGVTYPNATTGAGIYSGNTPRKLAIVAGNGSATNYPIVVSAGNPTYGLQIVRGGGTTGGTSTSGGEGYSYSSNSGTGTQVLSFTDPFFDKAICTCSTTSSLAVCVPSPSASPTGILSISTFNFSSSFANATYTFICIGQRGA